MRMARRRYSQPFFSDQAPHEQYHRLAHYHRIGTKGLHVNPNVMHQGPLRPGPPCECLLAYEIRTAHEPESVRLEKTSTLDVQPRQMIVALGDVISVKRDHERNIQGLRQGDHLAAIEGEMRVDQDGMFSGQLPLLRGLEPRSLKRARCTLPATPVRAEKAYSRFGKTKAGRATQTHIERAKTAQ